MTPQEIKDRVGEVAKHKLDDERAHNMEDSLAWDLIIAIADGNCINPQECCREALKSLELDFARWCA